MAAKILPSQAYLRECFNYDPDTGVLTWRDRPLGHFKSRRAYAMWNKKYSGRTAGSLMACGYLVVGRYPAYLIHRVIWKWVIGDDPPEQIDHIDGIRTNNRWENLRLATNSENQRNTSVQRNNQLGIRGVHKKGGRFRARIFVAGKSQFLGSFATAKEAQAAYDKAAAELFGEFHRS